MKPKLIRIFLLIVLLPLSIILVLGIRMARSEQENVQHRVHDLLLLQLENFGAQVDHYLNDQERRLVHTLTATPHDTVSLRQLVRSDTLLLQLFVLEKNGRLSHPPLNQLSTPEREFIRRTRSIWEAKEFAQLPHDNIESTQSRAFGWYRWFSGNGLRLLFWTRLTNGQIIGAELDNIRLMADLIALFPTTDMNDRSSKGRRVRLVNSGGAPIYQWGHYEQHPDELPKAALSLRPPLQAWKLQYFVSAAHYDELYQGRFSFSLFTGAVTLGVVLVGFAIYFFREHSREIREASQRVNFVNQVSHELKTPLTNIRMYAELLANRTSQDERSQQHLSVIISESQRLSRLITNVLTFASQPEKPRELCYRVVAVDDLVQGVIDNFHPSLEAAGVRVEFIPGAETPVGVDTDVVEQILGNLVSNVEKYGSSGGRMRVVSELSADRLRVIVRDYGPGIPISKMEMIFDPFCRLSDKLSDGVAGTGIGLTISRDLARLHGGDLRLIPDDVGACFELTLRVKTDSGHARLATYLH